VKRFDEVKLMSPNPHVWRSRVSSLNARGNLFFFSLWQMPGFIHVYVGTESWSVFVVLRHPCVLTTMWLANTLAPMSFPRKNFFFTRSLPWPERMGAVPRDEPVRGKSIPEREV